MRTVAFVDTSFVLAESIGGLEGGALLEYDDGRMRFQHRCKTIGDMQMVTAPLLMLGDGHIVGGRDPFTIAPSILCPDCGTHGFVIRGEWQAA